MAFFSRRLRRRRTGPALPELPRRPPALPSPPARRGLAGLAVEFEVPRCRSALPRRLAAIVECRTGRPTDQPFALASPPREPAAVCGVGRTAVTGPPADRAVGVCGDRPPNPGRGTWITAYLGTVQVRRRSAVVASAVLIPVLIVVSLSLYLFVYQGAPLWDEWHCSKG